MADLPRFGGARQAGDKAKFLLLQGADAPSLLASARAALGRLEAAHPHLAPLLRKRGAELLDDGVLDVERATLDAARRKSHDARVNDLIRAVAPCCGEQEGLAVLEALVQTSDAWACAGDALLRALAPHCHSSPAARVAFSAAAAASLDALAPRWRWAREKGGTTLGFAARAAADAALAEDIAGACIVTAVRDCRDAVQAGGEYHAVARTYAASFAFGAACLSSALATSRSKKLARRLLPVLSKVFEGPDDVCVKQARDAAAACLLSAATHNLLTSSAIDAAARAVLLQAKAGPRELGVALMLGAAKSKKGSSGALPDGALMEFLEREGAAASFNALATDRPRLMEVAAPQLVQVACGDSNVAALARELLATVTGAAPRIVGALAATPVGAARDALLEVFVPKCDADDVPPALLENGATPSLIALRLARGQAGALDDAAALAAAAPRDPVRDAPLAAALVDALHDEDALRAIAAHRSLQDVLVGASNADDAIVAAAATSRALRAVAARRAARHFAEGNVDGALACGEACLAGADATTQCLELVEAGAPPLLLCVARGDVAGAAKALGDHAPRCALRLNDTATAKRTWAPTVRAHLEATGDAATAAHACRALSSGGADDCLAAALRVLATTEAEQAVAFSLTRLEAEEATPIAVLEACFADAAGAARKAAGVGRGLRGALAAMTTADAAGAAPVLVGLAHADAATRRAAVRAAVRAVRIQSGAVADLVKGRDAAIGEDAAAVRRALGAALQEEGPLSLLVEKEALRCWSSSDGDRPLALALLDALGDALPWSAAGSTALDAALGSVAEPPTKKKRWSLGGSRVRKSQPGTSANAFGLERCGALLMATYLRACVDDACDDAELELISKRCLAALQLPGPDAVAVRFLKVPALHASLGDDERSRVFAALLGLLRRDGLAVKRSEVQAACSVIAPRDAWPRAWAAALRRPDLPGFCGDAEALLDASEGAPATCRPLCAAVRRLAPAAAKKQYLLDRIATSDGFKDAAAHTPDADGTEGNSTLRRILSALEDAFTSGADVKGVGAKDADLLAGIGGPDALRALAALLERCACDGDWESWLKSSVGGEPKTAKRVVRAAVRGFARSAIAVVNAASSGAEDDCDLLSACASALDDDGTGAGVAAVVLGLLQKRRDRAAEAVLRRSDREAQIEALGLLARACRPLVAASLEDDAELFEEACVERPLLRVKDVAQRRGQALALAAVVAGFCRRRVFALQKELPQVPAGKKRRRRPNQARKPAPAVQNDPQQQRRRLALCQGLSAALVALPYGVPSEQNRSRAYSTASRLEAEDQAPMGGDECSGHAFAACARAYARALRRALGLVDAPGLLSFLERALGPAQQRHVREAALEALAERLDGAALYDDRGTPSPFARVLLEETLPRVAHAVRADVAGADDDAKHAAVVATRCADVLARTLATAAAPQTARAAFAAVLESAAAAAEATVDDAERCAACLRLLQTLFATLREASLPALPAALPRFVAGCAAALRRPGRVHAQLRRAALDALVVVASTVPQFVHPHLPAMLDIIVAVEAKRPSSPSADEVLVVTAPDASDDDSEDDDQPASVDEARTARRVARALAAGVEPRLLVPAWVACCARAWAASDAAPAAALRLTKVCVDKCGRGAAKAHAAQIATLALGAHDACATVSDAPAVERACVELSLALLAKLSEGELVDWLRATEHWAATPFDGSEPSSDGSLVAAPFDANAAATRRAHAALHLATLAKRFRQLVAPRVADSSLDRLAGDLCGGNAGGSAADAATLRLLQARSVAAVAEVVAHLPEKLDADRCDTCVEGLVEALTHDATVWPDRARFLRHAAKALAPACAAVAERVQDVSKRRDFALKLMLLARDGSVPTRRAALGAVRAICDSLREDVADFANQLVQGVAEALDDAETAADARAVVVLVEQHTGIRLV